MRPDMICPIRREERKYLESQSLGLVEIQASEWIVRPSPLTISAGVKKVHKKCVAGSGGRCRGIRGGVIGMLITLGTWITARTHPFMRSSQSCKLGSWPWSLVLILDYQQRRTWVNKSAPMKWLPFLKSFLKNVWKVKLPPTPKLNPPSYLTTTSGKLFLDPRKSHEMILVQDSQFRKLHPLHNVPQSVSLNSFGSSS